MRRIGLDGDHKLVHADVTHLTHTFTAIQHVHAIGERTRKTVSISNRQRANLNACTRHAIGKSVTHAFAHCRMCHTRHARVNAHDGVQLHYAAAQLARLHAVQANAGANHIKMH